VSRTLLWVTIRARYGSRKLKKHVLGIAGAASILVCFPSLVAVRRGRTCRVRLPSTSRSPKRNILIVK
jgi:hypothetical protein